MESTKSPVNNIKLYENALRNYCSSDAVEILDFELSPATKAGDNYLSTIWRVFINYKVNGGEPQEITFIVKHVLENENCSGFVHDHQIYEKEVEALVKIFPLWSKWEGAFQAPKCYWHDDVSRITVVEDLGRYGFKQAQMKNGLDIDHCRLAIKKLAIFHASSMKLLRQDEKVYNKFMVGEFRPRGIIGNDDFMLNFMRDRLIYLIEMTKRWAGFECITKELENLNVGNSFGILVISTKFEFTFS